MDSTQAAQLIKEVHSISRNIDAIAFLFLALIFVIMMKNMGGGK